MWLKAVIAVQKSKFNLKLYKMKKIVFSSILVMLLAVMGACTSDDDEVSQVTNNELVGTWDYESTIINNVNNPYPHSEGCDKDHVIFESGGVYRTITFAEDCAKEEDKFGYSVSGSSLTFIGSDGSSTVTYSISNNTLSISYQYDYDEDGDDDNITRVYTKR